MPTSQTTTTTAVGKGTTVPITAQPEATVQIGTGLPPLTATTITARPTTTRLVGKYKQKEI